MNKPTCPEFREALGRFKNAHELAKALGISHARVRMWKSRDVVPHPWPQILKTVKPKKKKNT